MLLTEKFQELLEASNMPALKESDKSTMAVILENQSKEEAKILGESTVSSDVQQFVPIFMPLVRRVMPALIANELVGVQPMVAPTGYIYSLNFRYVGSTDRGVSPTNKAQIVQVSNASSIAEGDTITSGSKSAVVVYKEGNLLLVDNNEFVAADNLGSGVSVVATFSNEPTFPRILKGYSGKYTTAQAEQLSTNMKELGFSIAKKSVEAESRKLKAEYSIEMYQDLKNIHGLNADEELMNMMGVEVQNEIDREVVDFVNGLASVVTDIDLTAASGDAGYVSGRYDIEKFRHVAMRISHECREIARLTRRGAGNVILASPKAVTMLEQLKGYKSLDVAITGTMGVVGTFEGKKVVMDMFAEEDYITVLYKGADRRDAIAYLAPYVPVSYTRVTHSISGQPAIILSSRYGLVENPLNPEWYGRTMGINFGTIFG
jgi:hypothetical protein